MNGRQLPGPGRLSLITLLLFMLSLLSSVPYTHADTGLLTVSGATGAGTNAWTTPSNAFGTTDDNTYATAAPAKNRTTVGDWNTYGFDTALPLSAAITKVEIIPQYRVSTTASIASLQVQAVVSGTACGTAASDATEPTADTDFIADVTACRAWTRTDLLNANFGARITATRGNNNTAVTFSLDYVKVRITYNTPTYNQVASRWYQNQDSLTPGAALAATDTAATLSSYGQAARLRMLTQVTTTALAATDQTFKLQYAGKGAGTCAAPSGTPGSYTDVTGSTLIAYNNNPTPADGATISTTANDPTHGTDTVIAETYGEGGNPGSPNGIAINQDGEWDFSLVDNNAPSSTAYCFRMVKSDGTAFATYTAYPQLTTAVGILTVDIVDAGGSPVASPSTGFGNTTVGFNCTTTTATFGTSSQKVHAYNTLSSLGWTVSIAATGGNTSLWTAGTKKYDFNDPSGSPAGCSAGLDSDTYAGQLTINPSVGTITPSSGCTNTGISTGSSSAFNEGTNDSIMLLSASASAARGCYWDLTGMSFSQKIPSDQATGTYTLNLTLTILSN